MNIWTKIKKTIFYFLVGFVCVFVLIYFIEWLNFYNSIKHTINNEVAWLSFIGSYLGVLLSGLISLFGVIATITYYRNKDAINRYNSVLPNITFSVDYIIQDYEFIQSDITFIVRQDGTSPEDANTVVPFVVKVQNLGNGPAFELEIISLNTNTKIPHHHFLGVIENGKAHKKDFEIEFNIKDSAVIPFGYQINDFENLNFKEKDTKEKEIDAVDNDSITQPESIDDECVVAEDLDILKFESHVDCYFYDTFRNKYEQTIILILEYEKTGFKDEWNLYSYPHWPRMIKKSGR